VALGQTGLMEPPVLLVHGFATTCARTWGETGWIDLLKDAGREVIGVDLLGHGTAEKPHDPDAYADLEAGVARQLPAQGTVDAIGYSLGARVVLNLAAAQPQRFRRIVVAGVGANLFREDDSERIARAVEGSLGADEDDVVALHFGQLASAPGNDRAALAACLRRRRAPLTADQLARVTSPVLVVLGDRDFAGPADPLVEALPNARLVTLRGVDHFATPKEFRFIDAGLDFLGALPK
jgi:pimeloyl-ACP methyl ester carboxylesterase